MKKFILALVVATALVITIVKVYAYCSTDFKCMNDCLSRGYLYGYCKNACSWCQ
jgi:hypothetical protein